MTMLRLMVQTAILSWENPSEADSAATVINEG